MTIAMTQIFRVALDLWKQNYAYSFPWYFDNHSVTSASNGMATHLPSVVLSKG